MKVLVDTSVWSLVMRKRGPEGHPQAEKLTRLIADQEEVAITGSILQEILQAFRSEATVERVERYLTPFPLLALDRATSIEGANLHRRCAAKGTSASTIDCQIAAAALLHQHALLSADADFERIARVCDLVLL